MREAQLHRNLKNTLKKKQNKKYKTKKTTQKACSKTKSNDENFNSDSKEPKTATKSSSGLKSLPEKLVNYFTKRDKEYSHENDDVFVWRKFRKKNMESNRKKSSSRSPCNGVWLWLYLALLAIFVSPSHCIKLYGYDFDNIVSTKIYFPDHSKNCDCTIWEPKTIVKGSLIYAEVQPEIKLKFGIFEAAYTVSALKKSHVYDEFVFVTKISRLLEPIYIFNKVELLYNKIEHCWTIVAVPVYCTMLACGSHLNCLIPTPLPVSLLLFKIIHVF